MRKLIPVLLFALFFGVVVYFVEPPKEFSKLPFLKGLIFFTPLSLLLISINNIIFKSLSKSIVVTVGVITALVFQALNKLNPVSGILLLTTVILLVRFLKRKESIKYPTKIPKLSKLQKQ